PQNSHRSRRKRSPRGSREARIWRRGCRCCATTSASSSPPPPTRKGRSIISTVCNPDRREPSGARRSGVAPLILAVAGDEGFEEHRVFRMPTRERRSVVDDVAGGPGDALLVEPAIHI